MNNIKILYFHRLDLSEGIDVNKTTALKGFKFKPDVCYGCHDVLIMSMNLRDIVILNIHGVAYLCIINRISNCGVMALLNNTNLNEKCGI